MNNTDFRNFVASTPRRPANETPQSASRPGATPSTLGSRARSSVPMTPRSVSQNTQSDFARQLAQQRAASQPTRKFRSKAAPKGSKLAAGYRDRARAREEDAAQDDREARVQALEEQWKLGQIDRATFEQLRDTITGGELGCTHLVKGLDRQLLARVRRGEDVTGGNEGKEDPAVKDEAEVALDEFGQQEVAPAQKEEVVKKGEMAPPHPPKPVAGVKRSRNDILAEMRASRKAADEAKAGNKLGDRFRRIGGKEQDKYPRIEKDDQGREVLITKDENGRIKRKVRQIEVKEAPTDGRSRDEKGLLVPENIAKPLGVDEKVIALPPPQAEDDDEDIFAGVGTEYDPLKAEMDAAAALSSSDEDEEEEPRPPPAGVAAEVLKSTSSLTDEDSPRSPSLSQQPEIAEERDRARAIASPPRTEADITGLAPSEPAATIATPKRNYFGKSSSATSPPPAPGTDAPFKDPTILAALKRASAIASRTEVDNDEQRAPVQSTAAQRLLSQRDRDYEDMDMGFGGSRGGDEEDAAEEGGKRVKLSQWKGLPGEGDDDEEGKEGKKGKGGSGAKGKGERKRGGGKSKGDKDSAADVLKIIEGRKKA